MSSLGTRNPVKTIFDATPGKAAILQSVRAIFELCKFDFCHLWWPGLADEEAGSTDCRAKHRFSALYQNLTRFSSSGIGAERTVHFLSINEKHERYRRNMAMNRGNVYIEGTASSKASAEGPSTLKTTFSRCRSVRTGLRQMRRVACESLFERWWRVGEDSQQRGWSSSGNYLFKDAGCNGD